MEERDQNLAQATQRAAGHLPKGQGRGAGVSAYDAFAVAFEAVLVAAGYRIGRIRGAAGAPLAGD